MPAPNPDAMTFLMTRRSRPARTLAAPAPTREELMPILTAAVRVPDHGKLEPWRLIVLARPALERLARAAEAAGRRMGLDEEQLKKGVSAFADAPMIVAVIGVPRPTEKIPAREQMLSGACVALSLVNAALASGWGASWLTGWMLDDAQFLTDLGLTDGEWVVGFVHIGTETSEPPDRPRPDVAAITAWVEA